MNGPEDLLVIRCQSKPLTCVASQIKIFKITILQIPASKVKGKPEGGEGCKEPPRHHFPLRPLSLTQQMTNAPEKLPKATKNYATREKKLVHGRR